MSDKGAFDAELRASKNKEAAVIGGLALIASLTTAIGIYFGKKNRARDIERKTADLSACMRDIDDQSRYFHGLFSADYFVLDSNVWMAPEADSLFYILRSKAAEANGRICCLKSQLKEIDKLKKPPRSSNLGFNEGSCGRARHALKRIEEFRKAGLLRWVDDTDIAAGRTHVDEIFIDYFLTGVAPSATVRFVSGDQGLRALLMQVEQAKLGLYKTIDHAELIARADELARLQRKRNIVEMELSRLQRQ